MDIQEMLQTQPKTALKKFGANAVKVELNNMTFHNLAGYALEAAIALKMEKATKLAAQIIMLSNKYKDKTALAQQYLSEEV